MNGTRLSELKSREKNKKEESRRMYTTQPPYTLHIPSDFLRKCMFFRTFLFEENNDNNDSDEKRSAREDRVTNESSPIFCSGSCDI